MPPRIAPVQVAIVPIFRDEESRRSVEGFLEPITASLKGHLRFKVDWRDDRPGAKYAHWEIRGVPLRVEVGPRDIEAGQVTVVDRLSREKTAVPAAGLAEKLESLLEDFQHRLYQRALDFRAQHTFHPKTRPELVEIYRNGNGFSWAPFCDRAECELEIKAELGVTTRNKPFKVEGDFGDRCIWCGQPATTVVIFARSY
jgi:prolyl-tRNA synthetase